MEPNLKIKLNRNVAVATYRFTDYFVGFEKVEAVKRLFGEKTEQVLSNLKVEFAGFRGYMGINENDGHLLISATYLNKGDEIDLYLDIIHELVHVKQFFEGKELFDSDYTYVDRPTEVEAYRYAVAEARRLGLGEERICEYLRTERMSDEDLSKLAKAVNVNCRKTSK